MTDTRLAEDSVPVFSTRRARRQAERGADLAALARNPIGPSPLSQPLPVLSADPAPISAPAPVVGGGAAESVEFGELPAEVLVDLDDFVLAADGTIQAEPRHHGSARRHSHRRAPLGATPVAAGTPRAPQPKHRRRTAAQRFRGMLALAAVIAFAVSMSLPAAANFGYSAAVAAPAAIATAQGDGQAVTVAPATEVAKAAGGAASFSSESREQSEASYYLALEHQYRANYVPTTGAIRWPFPYSVAVSAPYGYSSVYAFGFHDGTDFVPGDGAAIQAIMAGTVTWVGLDGGMGYSVRIDTTFHGHALEAIYGHMQTGSSPMTVGEKVSPGDKVGLVGQTGEATGPHLHLGIKIDGQTTDPYVWLSLNATNAN